MDRATRRLFVGAVIALVILVGSVTFLLGDPSGPADGPPGTTPIEGVIVGVDQEGVLSISSFELRTADGSIRRFGLAELENGAEFPPGHLVEHSVTAEPVRVWYREEPEVDQAIRLEDALPAEPTPN
jgi:hypothetical protein